MKATFYVKFRPTFRNQRLTGINTISVTKGRPHDPRGGYTTVRFAVDFDPAMFTIPEVTASIGAADVEIIAEVLPPHAPEEEADEADVS